MIKKIYVCSPFKGDRKGNIRRAKKYSRWIFKKGLLPVCVHIFLEESTGMDERKGDRDKLLELGKEFVKMCDEVWVFGEISEGMKAEIETAKQFGIKIRVVGERNKDIILYDYEDKNNNPIKIFETEDYKPLGKSVKW